MPPLGARRTPHRRWPHRAARSVLLAAILLPLTVLSTGSLTAQASPTSSARLEDQLDRLNRESDQLVEQYLQGKLALNRIRKSLRALETQAAGAEGDLRMLQSRLGARASAAYVQGAGSAVAAVLGSDDPAAAIARVQVLDLLATRDSDLMGEIKVAGQAYDERTRQVSAAERAQATEVARLDAKKAEIERAVARTRTLLRELEAKNDASRTQVPSPPAPAQAAAPPPPAGGGGAAAAVRFALAQVGKPYQWGAAGPNAYDCSGLTMVAWSKAGISLPHSSAAQINVGRRVSASELRPGDLIFRYSPISHVSMYIGNGKQVSATRTGDYVRVQSLYGSIVGYSRPSG